MNPRPRVSLPCHWATACVVFSPLGVTNTSKSTGARTPSSFSSGSVGTSAQPARQPGADFTTCSFHGQHTHLNNAPQPLHAYVHVGQISSMTAPADRHTSARAGSASSFFFFFCWGMLGEGHAAPYTFDIATVGAVVRQTVMSYCHESGRVQGLARERPFQLE